MPYSPSYRNGVFFTTKIISIGLQRDADPSFHALESSAQPRYQKHVLTDVLWFIIDSVNQTECTSASIVDSLPATMRVLGFFALLCLGLLLVATSASAHQDVHEIAEQVHELTAQAKEGSSKKVNESFIRERLQLLKQELMKLQKQQKSKNSKKDKETTAAPAT